MNRLIVQHITDSDPVSFQVIRQSTVTADPQTREVPSPNECKVQGQDNHELPKALRWYMEHFLEYPYHPRTEQAGHVLESLKAWGTRAFQSLFQGGDAQDWYTQATANGLDDLHLQITSNDPKVLSWPWEALYDPRHRYLAHHCEIDRQITDVSDPTRLHQDLPTDKLNILLVIARPYEADVKYRSIARAMVALMEKNKFPVEVTLLRPPTFKRLRDVLKSNPGYFHIVHFDGHGGFGVLHGQEEAGNAPAGTNPHLMTGPQGCLIFENEKGEKEPVLAEVLSTLLKEHRIPAMVLNACQSATLDEASEDAFASVAASLVKAGVRSVVAMAYSLYVSGAQQFLPAFYQGLFEHGSFTAPTRAGRQAMLQSPDRVCSRGTYPLQDWLVPVLYQQQPLDLSFIKNGETAAVKKDQPSLPQEAVDANNPYGFIGRDAAVLAIERAWQRQPAGILVHGLGGVGKTTLARGFVDWLKQTNGLGMGCIWLSFQDVRSAEHVLNQIGTPLFGPDFITAPTDQKIELLGKTLKENPLVIVWDNFESASGNEAMGITPLMQPEDRGLLLRLLQALRGGRTKVLITSRSTEDWLPIEAAYRLPLSGLRGEERWEFCNAILDNLGKSASREDEGYKNLMDWLDGHPLLMRAVLPKLATPGQTPGGLLQQIKDNLGQAADPSQLERVNATLQMVEESLEEELRPLLVPLALHEGFVDADYLETMAKKCEGQEATRAQIDRLFSALANAGLLQHLGQNIFSIHPALTSHLRSGVLQNTAADVHQAWTLAFIDFISDYANYLSSKQLHEQRVPFYLHRINFHNALREAKEQEINVAFAALTQSLAIYAQHTRDYDEASRLFAELARHCHGVDDLKSTEASAYHQLGIIAHMQRDFEQAERCFLKSLEIEKEQDNEQGAAYTYHQLGIIAQEQRDFEQAETWYRKSLDISERQSNEQAMAGTYNQLGRIAQMQRHFEQAESWCLKSIEINEKLGNEHDASKTYGLLGVIALAQNDFKQADRWYRKSLEISKKLGDEYTAARNYHQLGRIAEEQHDFEQAEKWYLMSLEIKEKQSDEHGAAVTYHQLGSIAGERRDLEQAKRWYLKSLKINEKLGDEHTAAMTYAQLGLLSRASDHYLESGSCLIKAVLGFFQTNDNYTASRATSDFLQTHKSAPPKLREQLAAMWRESGLPDLSEVEKQLEQT